MTSEEKFERLVTDARDCAWQQLMRDIAADLRLYCVPSGPGRWGEVLVSTTAPKDALLASQNRVPAHLDRDQLRRWIRERCTALPLFPRKMPWIPVPARGQYDGDERFYRVVPRERWASVARGENHLRRHDRPEPQQIYAPGRYDLPTLGTYSGDVDEYGFYRDDALLEDSLLYPF